VIGEFDRRKEKWKTEMERERNESQRESSRRGETEREKRGETEREGEEGWGLESRGRAQKSTVSLLRYGHP